MRWSSLIQIIARTVVGPDGRLNGTAVCRVAAIEANRLPIACHAHIQTRAGSPRHRPEIVEVFHAAVLHTQAHRGLELFRDNSFARIGM